MEPVLYFYSTDGTNTFGPVTEDALRVLFRDKVIGPASFICPQGETKWKPVDIEWLRRAQLQTPRLPRYEPPPFVPTDTHKEREEKRVQQFQEVWDPGPHPALFKWGCVAFATVATLILAGMQDGIQNIIVGLLSGFLFIALIPFIISQSFKQPWRLRAWAIAMVIFCLLTFAGQASYNSVIRMEASMPAADGLVNVAPVVKPTAPVPAADARMEKPPVSDDPATAAHMAQVVQPVQQEMVDKIKASDTAEKACGNFDPATLTTQTDLATLRDGINKLRVTQSNVLAYFRTFDDRCRTALASGGFTADGIERFVVGLHQSEHIDQAVAIWQLRIKLTDDHLARLDFLDKHWGNWQPKDGKLLFVNQADLDTYNQLTQDLVADIKAGNDLQSQVLAK